MRKPRFLAVFTEHVKAGEWISGPSLARRLAKRGDRMEFLSKSCCQKLSNLERYGFLVRRRSESGLYEYCIAPRKKKRKPATWFSMLPTCTTGR